VAGRPVVLPPTDLGQEEQILHVLNRLAFGPSPEDAAEVRRVGIAAWIAAQLEPGSIPDSAVEDRLQGFRVLGLSTADLLREYPRPGPEVLERLRSGTLGPEERRRLLPPERRPGRITDELAAARLVRAAWSRRQLQEVLVDVWLNHFNVYAGKSQVRWFLPAWERDVIRPHALGRFRDLLLATARHPAMLFYLDNWVSVRPGLVIPAGPNAGRRAGLNENYARELLELHTLGVDGGYTQADVAEVARCFTGWSILRPREDGRFLFRPLAHDPGEKRVLGHVIPAGGGEADGMAVVDLLVRHPATARFVALKLARRLVADAPPPALVERAAAAFRESEGDIRAVVLAIVTAPEFFSREAYRAKVKKPLELVASAVRALGGQPAGGDPLRTGLALARQVGRLGEPLYEAEAPTGYADTAEAWLSAGGMLQRMHFAVALAGNRVPGLRVEPATVTGQPAGGPGASAPALPAGSGAGTQGRPDPAQAVALSLASPEFQRR
jgi:uncharacterized protein (DUF1800 family)